MRCGCYKCKEKDTGFPLTTAGMTEGKGGAIKASTFLHSSLHLREKKGGNERH